MYYRGWVISLKLISNRGVKMKNKIIIPACIITLMLIFSLIGCSNSKKPVSPVSPVSDGTKISSTTPTYKTYSNDRFGFFLSYPDIYSKKTESDNGDGISMESFDNLHTLKIWGGYNVNNSSGVDLMNMAKNRVSHILHDYADDHIYKLEYSGGEDTPIIFNEVGCVAGDQLVGFIISYPEKEKERYMEIVTQMTNELTKNTTTISKTNEIDTKTSTIESSNLNVVVNAGKVLSITLDENITTGYSWHYYIENNDLIKLDSENSQGSETNSQNNSKPNIVGAGSKHTWNFKGVKQGTTKISFKYYQSWNGEKSATKTSEYTIKIIE